jgi:hypothetical protein
MWRVPRYPAQSTEGASFLAADRKGSVINVMTLSPADAFSGSTIRRAIALAKSLED